MYSLQPYRPSGTIALFNMRGLPRNSPATYIAGGIVITLWLAAFFLGFPRLEGVTIFLLIVGLIVATIAVPLGVGFIWRTMVNTRLGEPQFRVNTGNIQRGTELQCEFIQPVKGQVAVAEARIQLVLHEWVQYTEGTDTRTQTNNQVIDEALFDSQQKNAGEDISLQAHFRIPEHATHNFNYSNNRLQWLLIVTVSIAAWPDFYEEYALDFDSDVQ